MLEHLAPYQPSLSEPFSSEDNRNAFPSSLPDKSKWTKNELKMIELLIKLIRKEQTVEKFEKIVDKPGNIKKQGKNKGIINLKSGNNYDNQKEMLQKDSVPFYNSKHIIINNNGNEPLDQKSKASSFESKMKLTPIGFDTSIKLPSNDQPIENHISMKMDIKPIPPDQLTQYTSEGDNDKNVFRSQTFNSYDKSDNLNDDSIKSDLNSTDNCFKCEKNTRKLSKNLGMLDALKFSKDKFDELETNEIPIDEPLVKENSQVEEKEHNFSPRVKSRPRLLNVVVPYSPIAPLIKSFASIRRDKNILTGKEGPTEAVGVPVHKSDSATTDSVRQENDKDVLSSELKGEINEKKLKTISLPQFNQNNVQLKNLDDTNVSRLSNLELDAGPSAFISHTNPLSKGEQNVTLNSDALSKHEDPATTSNPHLEELSFWNKLRNITHSFIKTHFDPLLNFPGSL